MKIKEKSESFKCPKNAKLVNGYIEFITEDNIDYWIKIISKYTVLDLQIQEFSMEDIFIRYYDSGGNQLYGF